MFDARYLFVRFYHHFLFFVDDAPYFRIRILLLYTHRQQAFFEFAHLVVFAAVYLEQYLPFGVQDSIFELVVTEACVFRLVFLVDGDELAVAAVHYSAVVAWYYGVSVHVNHSVVLSGYVFCVAFLESEYGIDSLSVDLIQSLYRFSFSVYDGDVFVLLAYYSPAVAEDCGAGIFRANLFRFLLRLVYFP